MTSAVHGNHNNQNQASVVAEQPSWVLAKKMMCALKLPFQNLGNRLEPNKVPSAGRSKVTLRTKIPENTNPAIKVIREGTVESRPQMIAFESYKEKVTQIASDVEKALVKQQWTDVETDDLEDLYQETLNTVEEGHTLRETYADVFYHWQDRVVRKKGQKLQSLILPLENKLREADPLTYTCT